MGDEEVNAAQLIAWLVCLLLGFFACVLAVHNMGQTSLLRQRVEELEARDAEVRAAKKELKRIRETLEAMEGKLDGAPSAGHDNEAPSSPGGQQNGNEPDPQDES